MLFNSYPFIFLFLPIVLITFLAIGAKSLSYAAGFLALASLVFYSWWDYRFLPILLGSIFFNYLSGLVLHRLYAANGPGWRVNLALAMTVIVNLALLGFYKYAGFAADIIDHLAGTHIGPLSIILPIGISFFTFTQIAFLVDTANGEVEDFDPLRYVLFVTYFPHLIAGPILHHKEMMPQFAEKSTYRWDAGNFAMGIAYFSIGLAKKCILADNFSPDVAEAFGAAAKGVAVAAPLAWKGVLAFTLQLYFDFSGYIDMAIGLSLMFNVRLPLNFNSPYKSASIIDFWRRWHITLSRFLRDYLYIALGGNRRGRAMRYVNLFITMLLGGLWHGAAMTFVVWGALHGVYLIANHAWRAMKPEALLRVAPAPLRHVTAVGVTMVCVMVAWVFFRAADFPTAVRVLQGMAGLNGFDYIAPPRTSYGDFEVMLSSLGLPLNKMWVLPVLLYSASLFVVFALPNSQEIVEPDRFRRQPNGAALDVRWQPGVASGGVCAILVLMSILTFSRVSEFLYFQF